MQQKYFIMYSDSFKNILCEFQKVWLNCIIHFIALFNITVLMLFMILIIILIMIIST